MLNSTASAASAVNGAAAAVVSFIASHTYLGVFALMALESASLPIPSEVVLPAIGYLAATGAVNFYLAFAAAVIGSMVGIAIDYYVAYFVGKDVVYRHLQSFHIKKSTLDAFDNWFARNGSFAVFISRLIPIVRGLISFPAGFAQMPQKKFYLYSFLGTAIWDITLMLFGYYALDTANITVMFVAVAAFGIVLYAIYVYALKTIRKNGRSRG
jgi:membrane protein DedA with SNARE-associated domain